MMLKLMVAILIVLMAGCAGQPKKEVSQAKKVSSYEGMTKHASDVLATGKTDEAVAQLKMVADVYPKRKEPWQKMAQIKFDAYQYGLAVVYAQEVLRLDAVDQLAHSIIAVSGLRLSSSSLGVLRSENGLSGSVKSEAISLAEVLRERLGVDEIVSPASKEKKRVRKVKRSAEVDSLPAVKNGIASGDGGADPFGSLK